MTSRSNAQPPGLSATERGIGSIRIPYWGKLTGETHISWADNVGSGTIPVRPPPTTDWPLAYPEHPCSCRSGCASDRHGTGRYAWTGETDEFCYIREVTLIPSHCNAPPVVIRLQCADGLLVQGAHTLGMRNNAGGHCLSHCSEQFDFTPGK